ncbi:hypothetical protein TWF718_004125 [Orbilia javanica]|uniref:Uncharacterized protein n=1 Tax=Orbilia javanica TaxID=47235 RepID=A0AAN8N4T4_9PEZI
MTPISLNRRAILALSGALTLFLLFGAVTHHVKPVIIYDHLPESWGSKLPPPQEGAPSPVTPSPPPFQEEIFPLAKAGKIPKVNPKNIVKGNNLKTPLFIGFTRNWYLLEQAVVSYVAAGWDASQIIVIDNSGVMDSNLHGLLTPKNPWYLNHTRLGQLGVSVKRTPTLLTFAQLQNFFINYAIEQSWEYFFWSHMDVVVLSKEYDKDNYRSLYQRVIDCLRETLEKGDRWALKFFAYDWLTLVNVAAMKDIGGWDTQIPYYTTDCDMYSRLTMKDWPQGIFDAGHIYDVGSHLKDLAVLFPAEGQESELNTTRFNDLKAELERMMKEKHENKGGRNYWQAKQDGGQGEPFWRNPKGFERAINFWIDKGRELFKLKWDHPDCNLVEIGRKYGEEWTKGPGNE